jgi:hypothetical protein
MAICAVMWYLFEEVDLLSLVGPLGQEVQRHLHPAQDTPDTQAGTGQQKLKWPRRKVG